MDQIAHQTAQRRGGGTLVGESRMYVDGELWDIEQVVGDEPTPEFAAQVAEQQQRLLDLLDHETLRRVAPWKLEDLTNDELVGRGQLFRRTIARKLETNGIIWSSEPVP